MCSSSPAVQRTPGTIHPSMPPDPAQQAPNTCHSRHNSRCCCGWCYTNTHARQAWCQAAGPQCADCCDRRQCHCSANPSSGVNRCCCFSSLRLVMIIGAALWACSWHPAADLPGKHAGCLTVQLLVFSRCLQGSNLHVCFLNSDIGCEHSCSQLVAEGWKMLHIFLIYTEPANEASVFVH